MEEYQKGECVYILKSGKKMYKIGRSEDLQERVVSYRTHLPSFFEVVRQYMADNSNDLEKGLHTIFQHKKVKGEWFQMRKDDLQICDNVVQSYALRELEEKTRQKSKGYKIVFSEQPLLDAYIANIKYLTDYAEIVRQLETGMTLKEIVEWHQGEVSETTIKTVKKLLKHRTPNSEFVMQWPFIINDLAEGLTIQQIVDKYRNTVSPVIVQTIRRILRHLNLT